MTKIKSSYELQTGSIVEVIFGSSGKLTAQIIAGAPYDLFLSADTKYPEKLVKEGFTIGKPNTYALGRLVLWTTLDYSTGFDKTRTNQDTKFAMANPSTAPYGRAAQQFLESTHDWENAKGNAVYGESVAQVNQFILSKAVEIGITSKSSMYSKAFENNGTWRELPSSDYDPIEQAMVILNNRPEMQKEAQAFFDFILSDQGQEILNNFGYSSPEN